MTFEYFCKSKTNKSDDSRIVNAMFDLYNKFCNLKKYKKLSKVLTSKDSYYIQKVFTFIIEVDDVNDANVKNIPYEFGKYLRKHTGQFAFHIKLEPKIPF